MPKRVGYLYRDMCDEDLIRLAIREGSRGKRRRWDVKEVIANEDLYVKKVYDLLINRKYVPTVPKNKVIFERNAMKLREISIVPFYPDGIIHQLMVMVAKDALMRGMYRWSCASIPGRGNKCAADYVRKALNEDPRGTKYCLKMDIRHYYPSIPIDGMMAALERKIKDREYLDLARAVITSDKHPGLSIGFYTNQWYANFYLEPLDNFILTLDGVKRYVRNMDDMVLMGPNKKKLHRSRWMIEGFLNERLNLTLKKNWQVFPVEARGIDFVGYRFYHTHTTLRRRNFLRFARNCRRVKKKLEAGEPVSYKQAAGLLARRGQLKHCDGVKARKKYFDPIGEKVLKDIIRAHAKKGDDANGRGSAEAGTDLHRPGGSPDGNMQPAGSA